MRVVPAEHTNPLGKIPPPRNSLPRVIRKSRDASAATILQEADYAAARFSMTKIIGRRLVSS